MPYDSGLPDPMHDFNIPDLLPPDTTGVWINGRVSKRLSFDIGALWEHQIPNEASIHTLEAGLNKEIDDLMFETPDSLSSPKPTSHSTCTCVQRAISTNEAVELTMWGQKDLSSNVYSTLQQQKAALARCVDLLTCQTCCTQASYIMMLLSICRKLHATLGRICHSHGSLDDQGRASSSDSGAEMRKRKKDGNVGSTSASTNISEVRRGYGISIRERQLDDDDECLVLRSLVSTRLRTLVDILDRLDKVISQYNWPVHKGICRELRASLRTESYL